MLKLAISKQTSIRVIQIEHPKQATAVSCQKNFINMLDKIIAKDIVLEDDPPDEKNSIIYDDVSQIRSSEYIFIKLRLKTSDYVFGVVYHHPAYSSENFQKI